MAVGGRRMLHLEHMATHPELVAPQNLEAGSARDLGDHLGEEVPGLVLFHHPVQSSFGTIHSGSTDGPDLLYSTEITTRNPQKVSYDVQKDRVNVAVTFIKSGFLSHTTSRKMVSKLSFIRAAFRLGETVGVETLNKRQGRARIVQPSAHLETHKSLIQYSLHPTLLGKYTTDFGAEGIVIHRDGLRGERGSAYKAPLSATLCEKPPSSENSSKYTGEQQYIPGVVKSSASSLHQFCVQWGMEIISLKTLWMKKGYSSIHTMGSSLTGRAELKSGSTLL
ncbi:hypothetical protein BDP27DRAFT_1431794 [Rhodocollybia butyracea]|uniref:Uncharacterized protein n=1 Tax=Rhodocollybia butyracea TaxID=206335 RepID=A0A9P5PBB8_9AGAR|nr:hypothetical protein BDP27DRAFT_1431794 [Rhodocollybia butyracea]